MALNKNDIVINNILIIINLNILEKIIIYLINNFNINLLTKNYK